MIQNIKYFKKVLPSFIFNLFKNIFHILRYHNIINPNYNVDESIKFGDSKTGHFLKKKILNSKIFLEFGSGNTTLLAFKNNKQYYSVESDRNFYFYLKKRGVKNLFFYSLGYVGFFSYPLLKNSILNRFYKKKAKLYSSKIFQELKKKLIFPDLILVDGRYRVLCMLNIFLYLRSHNLTKTVVILDDFKERDYYHEIKSFFKVNLEGRLGVFYINEQAPIENIENLIEKFSADPR
jgi:hypothetical protein